MDRESLVRAVMEAPKDDAPLLVFADWLDEHGEAVLAARIRAVVIGFTEAQWWLIGRVLDQMVHDPSVANGSRVRILLGGYSHVLSDVTAAAARRGLAKSLRAGLRDERDALPMKVGGRELRKKYSKKWDRVVRRLFGSGFIFEPLGRVIHDRVRERVPMKTIGVTSTDLACRADDVILGGLTGEPRRYGWCDIDPDTVPDLANRLKAAVDGFDPWTFDWSKVRLPPKQRQRMAAAGMIFSESPSAQETA